MSAAIQTLWVELAVATLADAGVTTCVISPGSRSTPLVAALAADGRFALPTLIDERAAAFFALGVARATGTPTAMVCTSGTAAAHYLPAIVEASEAGVPLVAITADRPPELQHCGAAQTIDQVKLYGGFVRAAFDLGAAHGSEPALRAVRRTMLQAVTAARGPRPGPVHVNVPLRKPLEPAAPSTPDEHALARIVAALRGRVDIAPPRLAADGNAIAALAHTIAAEPRGVIVGGALPATFARDAVFELARRAGYPIVAEAGSQLRFARRPAGVVVVEHFDLLTGDLPRVDLVIRIGAEPVAVGWGIAKRAFVDAAQFVLADTWTDPDGVARVIVGDVAATIERVVQELPQRQDEARREEGDRFGREGSDADRGDDVLAYLDEWRAADARAREAVERALHHHPRCEGAALRAAIDAVPDGAIVQIGNSLPIRVVDQVCPGGRELTILTQRGAAGIDGLVSSAAGATHAGKPVLLVLGDVSFAHDLGGLLATREVRAPLAIVVVDNGGGRIFAGLPYAQIAARTTFDRHFVAAPEIDPSAVAAALGIRAVTAASPAAIASAVATALSAPGVTVIHAPVAATGALELRTSALELLREPHRGVRHG
jgi:2-succinyl-5-enolpyruvyl-6-hydroxy-3-cyclohexene-1-carboxylate synthase